MVPRPGGLRTPRLRRWEFAGGVVTPEGLEEGVGAGSVAEGAAQGRHPATAVGCSTVLLVTATLGASTVPLETPGALMISGSSVSLRCVSVVPLMVASSVPLDATAVLLDASAVLPLGASCVPFGRMARRGTITTLGRMTVVGACRALLKMLPLALGGSLRASVTTMDPSGEMMEEGSPPSTRHSTCGTRMQRH